MALLSSSHRVLISKNPRTAHSPGALRALHHLDARAPRHHGTLRRHLAVCARSLLTHTTAPAAHRVGGTSLGSAARSSSSGAVAYT